MFLFSLWLKNFYLILVLESSFSFFLSFFFFFGGFHNHDKAAKINTTLTFALVSQLKDSCQNLNLPFSFGSQVWDFPGVNWLGIGVDVGWGQTSVRGLAVHSAFFLWEHRCQQFQTASPLSNRSLTQQNAFAVLFSRKFKASEIL